MILHTLFMCGWILHVHAESATHCEKGMPCANTDFKDSGQMYKEPRNYVLPRTEPGKVGDVTELNLEPGMTHKMITRAKVPPIFEIPDFLSASECDQIIQLARERGLKTGTIIDGDGVKNILKTRTGETTFINPKKYSLMLKIQKRITSLTQLPAELVGESEEIQVGHYGTGGFYNAHYDSSFVTRDVLHSRPCCHNIPGPHSESKCSVCRYITVLMYLNEVEEGGETAFPIADVIGANITEDHYNLTTFCYKSSVLVTPQKGKAIMWYNNYRDPTNGWIDVYDPYSLHGGCPVIKGEKWISNVWLNAALYENRNHKSIYPIR